MPAFATASSSCARSQIKAAVAKFRSAPRNRTSCVPWAGNSPAALHHSASRVIPSQLFRIRSRCVLLLFSCAATAAEKVEFPRIRCRDAWSRYLSSFLRVLFFLFSFSGLWLGCLLAFICVPTLRVCPGSDKFSLLELHGCLCERVRKNEKWVARTPGFGSR